MSLGLFSVSLAGVLITSHIIGSLLISWGGLRLIQGLRGEGQSAEGVALLRGELLGLLKPLSWGALAVSGLLGLAMWERSPLTQWVQVIAPLSTALWVTWSHFSARRVRSGELFEALVPLSVELSRALDERAKSWVEQSPPLSARGLMHTAFQATQDAQGDDAQRRPLDLEVSLKITQDSLRELHKAALRFPLAQQLTLTDWIYEGERLTGHWGAGLKWITRGRALLNPLTLLDHKGLWGWSQGSPAELFQRELAAWLHRGLYVLVSQKVSAYLITQEHVTSQATSAEGSVSCGLSDEASRLWSLIAFKFTVPFWLYLGLSSIAAIEGHGLFGVALSALTGALFWRSARRASALKSWREAFARLATHRRAPRASEGQVPDAVRGALARLSDEYSVALNDQEAPCVSLVDFAQQGWSELSKAYRRPLPELSEPNPALDHLNVTLPDLIATLYWLCDDLKRFSDSAAGGLLSALSEHLGGRVSQGFEPMLLEAVQRWSLDGDSQQIASHIVERDEGVQGEQSNALVHHAQRADLWIGEHIYGANFIVRALGTKLLHAALEGVQGWIAVELSTRLTPLYRGDVPAPSGEETEAGGEAQRLESSEEN